MILQILDIGLQQGALYGFATVGIMLTIRILNWPDLTVDGSFTLGGGVAAVMITAGKPLWSVLLVSALAGFVAGSATCLLNRKLGISKILAGILVMLILYSINLRIMGRANISLLQNTTLFTPIETLSIVDLGYSTFFITLIAVPLLCVGYLLTTRFGLFLRGVGDNEFMVRGTGINTTLLFLLGLGMSNMLVAISGALVAQNQGFADIGMGTGLIIIGLAALIIGEVVVDWIAALRRLLSVKWHWKWLGGGDGISLLPWGCYGYLVAALVGAFCYFITVAVCLRAGLQPTDLKLATGLLVIFGIALRLKGPTVESYMRGKF